MDFATTALDFANLVNFIAVLFLTRAIIKDRKVLRGFSVSGSFLTFVAILSFEVAYFYMGNLISFGLGLVSLVFWLLAFVFTFRKFAYDRRHPPQKTL
jgi:uncharacterized membrane protein